MEEALDLSFDRLLMMMFRCGNCLHVTVRFLNVTEFNSLTLLYIKFVAYLRYACKMYFFLSFMYQISATTF